MRDGQQGAADGPLIRPPLQRRSQESLERVLQAGLELLQEVGFEGFTLQEVSRRAGVSIGSIYARAASKDALILAIYEREMERLAAENARLEQASDRAGLGPRELIETLVREMAQTMLGNASVLRVFMHRSVVDAEIRRRGAERSHEVARAFEGALLAHRAELRHADPELAVDVAYRFVYCALARRITHGPRFESERELSDDACVRELATAAADYLLSG
jgi:AcrR family transcriptional regulator